MNNLTKAQILFFSFGIIWVLLFPLVSITTGEDKPRGFFVDENALLHNQGTSGINQAFLQECFSSCGEASNYQELREEVDKVFQRSDLWEYYDESYGRNKSVVAAISKPFNGGKKLENLVLVVDPSQQNHHDSFKSLLCFSQYLMGVRWLSMNIVLLVPETIDGVKSFINDFSGFDESLASAAFGVKFTNSSKQEVMLNHFGKNGELPNMDMITLAVATSSSAYRKEVLRKTIKLPLLPFNLILKTELFPENKVLAYKRNLEGVLSYIFALAFPTEEATGVHSEFLKNGIDALTFDFSMDFAKDPTNRLKSQHEALMFIEKVLRCISNLHEKLHHSYDFYVLISKSKFASIDEYAGTLACLLIPLLIALIKSPEDVDVDAKFEEETWKLFLKKSILLVSFSFLTGLGLINYPLSLILSLVSVPVLLILERMI